MTVGSEHFGSDTSENTDEGDLLPVLDLDDTDSDDTGSEESDPPEFDAQAELEALRDGTMSKKDFADFQRNLTRQLGQIPTLQSTVAKLSKARNADPDSVSANTELLNAIAAALPSVLDSSDPAYSAIAALQDKRARAEATRDAIAQMRANAEDDTPASDDGTGNQMSPEDAAAWNAASNLVNGYARAKGIDGSTIEKAVWDKAVEGSMGIPDRAADAMYKVIDGLATGADGAQTDRARRKAAGEATAPDQSGSGSNKGLTLARLKTMTPKQIAALPPEEVDRLMARS